MVPGSLPTHIQYVCSCTVCSLREMKVVLRTILFQMPHIEMDVNYMVDVITYYMPPQDSPSRTLAIGGPVSSLGSSQGWPHWLRRHSRSRHEHTHTHSCLSLYPHNCFISQLLLQLFSFCFVDKQQHTRRCALLYVLLSADVHENLQTGNLSCFVRWLS